MAAETTSDEVTFRCENVRIQINTVFEIYFHVHN